MYVTDACGNKSKEFSERQQIKREQTVRVVTDHNIVHIDIEGRQLQTKGVYIDGEGRYRSKVCTLTVVII